MEYRPVRVSDLIRDINRELYLPAIQREFVWGTDKGEWYFRFHHGRFPHRFVSLLEAQAGTLLASVRTERELTLLSCQRDVLCMPAEPSVAGVMRIASTALGAPESDSAALSRRYSLASALTA